MTVVLLAAIGAVTYICIARMLPAVYTNELESGLENAADWLLKELADYDSIEDAWQRLAYFEGDNQAFVKIIDEDLSLIHI